VEELLDIDQGKDDPLFPVFCSVLIEKGQARAAKLIRQNLEKQQQLQQQQQQSQMLEHNHRFVAYSNLLDSINISKLIAVVVSQQEKVNK